MIQKTKNVQSCSTQIATWYDNRGLVPVVPKLSPLSPPGTYDRNKTYIVSTIEEPPYVMRHKAGGPESTPNDPYRGFCVDLAKMLSDKLEIKCKSPGSCYVKIEFRSETYSVFNVQSDNTYKL